MKKLHVFVLTFLGSLIVIDRAFAYIDPATGSMILQALFAAFAAVSLAVGAFWKQVRAFLGQMFGKKESKEVNSDGD